MGLPSGAFTNAKSGKLSISFSGYYRTNSSDWGSGDWQLDIRCIVAWGSQRRTAIIGVKAPTAQIDVDYQAGDSVSVSMEVIAYHIVGAGTISATKLTIRCRLQKAQ